MSRSSIVSRAVLLGIAVVASGCAAHPATADHSHQRGTAIPAKAALATVPSAAEKAPEYSVKTTPIGTLLDHPRTLAIVNKYLPGFSTAPYVSMARAMTLAQVQPYAPAMLTNAALGKIDAALSKLDAE